jgi:osmoprotectant transport system substrate-binding protein
VYQSISSFYDQEEDMTSPIRFSKAKALSFLVLIPLLILAACGSSSTGGGSTASKGTITVSGKKDVEAELLTEMYTQLLKKAGYTVKEHLAFGDTTFNFEAIQSGDTDLYPEFTATGLDLLKIKSTYDPAKDYQAVKSGYEQKYKITWLDPAPLDDGYALCMKKSQSQSLGISSISQLASKVSQLTLETPSDGVDFVNALKTTYGFDTTSFKKTQTVDYAVAFDTVASGQAQVTVCYGTDATVPQQNFVFLQDDKNGFPAFNPAPIVRDSVLLKYPDIKTILNPLAPHLTTDVSIQLQQEVAQKKASMSVTEAVRETATAFLQSVKLL